MISEILVQNYYELNGTFEGVQNSKVILEKLRKDKESLGKLVKVEESSGKLVKVCKSLLGYREDGVDPEVLMEVREKCLLGKGDNRIPNASTKFELDKIPGDRGAKVANGDGRALAALVTEYYRKDERNLIMDNGAIIPFNGWLLRNSKRSCNKVAELPAVQKCLVKAVQSDVKEPTVYAGILYAPFEITDEEMLAINKAAISRAMLKNSPVKELLNLSIAEIVTLSKCRPELYLKLLDYSRVKGVTYKEVLSWLGIHVQDLCKAYELTGYAFISLGDTCLVYDETADCWLKETLDQFMLRLQRRAKEFVEAGSSAEQEVTHELSGF